MARTRAASSEAVNWQGGGGFRYYKLAPSLLRQDAYGQWVINKEYNAEMLAQALCKLEGFTYAPSDAHYWMHGHSTERDFIYVTTANLNHEQLQQLSDEVGHGAQPVGVVYCFPWAWRLSESHREEDSQAGAVALRVGA